jgi:hypothetical protein
MKEVRRPDECFGHNPGSRQLQSRFQSWVTDSSRLGWDEHPSTRQVVHLNSVLVLVAREPPEEILICLLQTLIDVCMNILQVMGATC